MNRSFKDKTNDNLNQTVQMDGLVVTHTSLSLAASLGTTHIVTALLKKGSDINRAASNGNTPLILSILNRHFDIAKVLLDHGANANITDSHEQWPIHLLMQTTPRYLSYDTIKHQHYEIFKQLLPLSSVEAVRVKSGHFNLLFAQCLKMDQDHYAKRLIEQFNSPIDLYYFFKYLTFLNTNTHADLKIHIDIQKEKNSMSHHIKPSTFIRMNGKNKI